MRSFTTFVQAKNEIRRDLAELGTTIFAGYQSMDLSELDREKLTTKELQDYDYIVLVPKLEELIPTQPWADVEWAERLAGIKGRPSNPGNAWKLRLDVWQPLIEVTPTGDGDATGAFSYTYSERLYHNNMLDLLKRFMQNPASRQIWVSIWDPRLDSMRVGKRRVPCSLGYQVSVRGGRVNIAYHMRSCDFGTHFDNDIWMACQLQGWFAENLGLERGTFVHKVGSLHIYAAKVSEVF